MFTEDYNKKFVTIQPEENKGVPLMAAPSASMMEMPCFFMVEM